jgi:chorismate-pyruvate lyase
MRRTSPDIDVATAVALLQSLNVEILGSRSATLTLEKWCHRQHLGEEPQIVAKRLKGRPKPLRPEQREWLQVSPEEEVRHRKVQLLCGSRVLSEADNWYLPNRLTAEMNRLLDTTDTPFGKAVQPLNPRRRTFEVKLLWSPLSEGRVKDRSRRVEIPDSVFEHRVVLYSGAHKPLALVRETYKRQLLAGASAS